MLYLHKQYHLLLILLLQLILLPSATSASEMETPPNELPSFDCVINPSIVVDLASSVSGVLDTVRVDRSDFVEAGTIIAELDSAVAQATLELARTRAELTSEIELRTINAAFGERQSARIEDLYNREVISFKDLDQTQTETKLTQAQLQQAVDNKKIAEMEVARAQAVLTNHVIRSPITGVVIDKYKGVGEYVDGQPIVRVAQLSPLSVEVILPVEQLGNVHNGMLAEVWSEAVGGKWQAKVSRIDSVADVASGTYGVRLTLENPDYKIPAGLRCRINFIDPLTVSSESYMADDEAHSLKSISSIPTSISTPPNSRLITNPVVEPIIIDQAPVENNQCGRLGPFVDQESAQQNALILQNNGVAINIKKISDQVQTAMHVMSPAFDSKKKVKAYLKRLREAGDKDYFQLAQKGNQPYKISLGLFSQSEKAQQRLKNLQQKGFIAEMVPEYTPLESYWLLMNGDIAQLDNKSLLHLAKNDQDLEIIPCNQQVVTE